MSEERTAKGPTTITELSRAQQAAGRRTAESRATVPDVSWTVEVDAGEGFDTALLAAVAAALREHPNLNASYRDGTVVAHGRVNLGIAVAGDDATVVPVLHDADERADLAGDLERLRADAAGGEQTAAAFAGATFTVAGLGVAGVRRGDPAVTPGQVAVLHAGAPEDRAVVAGGAVEVRRRADLTLAVDARAVQGTAGPRFLQAVAARL